MAQTPDEYLALNRAFWDELAQLHQSAPLYKIDAFRRGQNVLDWQVREGVGDVAGKRLLHLQCHFGLDTLCLARMGARVTGLDFSPVALSYARALAAESGIAASFVESDVLDPPPGLTGFDIVFASWGAIAWVRDMAAWMRVACGALRPGGRLYLHDFHPVMTIFDERAAADAPFSVRYSYDDPAPFEQEQQSDYATPAVLTAHRSVQWFHGLGRILNAAIEAGFTVCRLDELDLAPAKQLPQLVQVDEDYWGLPPGVPQFPLGFALSAVKA